MINVTSANSTQVKSAKFPKLMKSRGGLIVLMSKDRCGIIVKSNGQQFFNVGLYDETWIMSEFSDYNEFLTIQNVLE